MNKDKQFINTNEILKIGECHIYKALGYMDMPHIGKTHNNIVYIYNEAENWAILHNGKKYGHREVLRVAYLFAVNEPPKGHYGEFSDEQVNWANEKMMPSSEGQWNRINYQFWEARGFVQERIEGDDDE